MIRSALALAAFLLIALPLPGWAVEAATAAGVTPAAAGGGVTLLNQTAKSGGATPTAGGAVPSRTRTFFKNVGLNAVISAVLPLGFAAGDQLVKTGRVDVGSLGSMLASADYWRQFAGGLVGSTAFGAVAGALLRNTPTGKLMQLGALFLGGSLGAWAAAENRAGLARGAISTVGSVAGAMLLGAIPVAGPVLAVGGSIAGQLIGDRVADWLGV